MTTMNRTMSSNCKSKFLDVLGTRMHYLEAGSGDPILFLHGVPTSSYLWRNVIPHLSPLGRCIAVDLIGFGQSGKPDIQYSISDHINYIEHFIQALGLKRITLIMHGWGSVVGLDYAMRHPANCKGLVFYEAFLRCVSESELALPVYEEYAECSDQSTMSDIVSNGISFIDKILPQHIMRTLSEDELTNYRAPFIESGSGKPIAQYLKELPAADLSDARKKCDEIIATFTQKLMTSKLPKLMLYSIPGFITPIATVMWAKEHLPNIEVIDIGEELHLAQESCPAVIGEAISVWMQGLEQRLL